MKLDIEMENCHFCDARLSSDGCASSITLDREKLFRAIIRDERTRTEVPCCAYCRNLHRGCRCPSHSLGIGIAVAALSCSIFTHWTLSWFYSAELLGIATISGMVLGEIIERWYFEMRVIPSKADTMFTRLLSCTECSINPGN